MNQRVEAMDIMMKSQPAQVGVASARSRDDWAYALVLAIAFLPLFAGAVVSRVASTRPADGAGDGRQRSIFAEAAADVRSAVATALMDR
jgi:hypothetical protein